MDIALKIILTFASVYGAYMLILAILSVLGERELEKEGVAVDGNGDIEIPARARNARIPCTDARFSRDDVRAAAYRDNHRRRRRGCFSNAQKLMPLSQKYNISEKIMEIDAGKRELVKSRLRDIKSYILTTQTAIPYCELLTARRRRCAARRNNAFLAEGETIEAMGEYVTHPSFGRQFKVEYYEKQLPATEKRDTEISLVGNYQRYRTCDGETHCLGVYARHVRRDGKSPGVACRHPRHISKKKAAEIGETFREQFGMRNVDDVLPRLFRSVSVREKFTRSSVSGAWRSSKTNPYISASGLAGSDLTRRTPLPAASAYRKTRMIASPRALNTF